MSEELAVNSEVSSVLRESMLTGSEMTSELPDSPKTPTMEDDFRYTEF